MFNLSWSPISAYVASGLGALLLVSNVGWYITYEAKSHAYQAEVLGRKNDKLSYEKAQAEAEKLSLDKARAEEKKDAEIAQKADANYAALRDKYNAAIVRYQSAQRQTGGVNLPVSSDTSVSSDPAGEGSGIFITVTDAQTCGENTARLQAVKQWADELAKSKEK